MDTLYKGYSLMYWKPVEAAWNWCDVITSVFNIAMQVSISLISAILL